MNLRSFPHVLLTFLLLFLTHRAAHSQAPCWEWLHPYPVSFALTDAAVLSDSVMVVVGYNGSILRTVDGGDTWSCFNDGTIYRFNTVDFLDDQFGIVGGEDGRLHYTTDGGEHWNLDKAPQVIDFIKGVHIYNRLNAVAVGGTLAPRNIILRTTNGGESWVNQPSGSTQTLNGTYMVDSMNVWAVGIANHVLHSTDGGSSWEVVDVGLPSLVSLQSISFADAERGVIVGEKGTRLITTDGGESWKQITDPPATANYYDVEWYDSQHGLIAGEGQGLGTTDGGESWFPTPPAGYYLGIGVQSGGSRAVAVGTDGRLAMTTDRGENWSQKSKSSGDILLDAIGAADSSHIMAVSLKGDLLWTRDAGHTWGMSKTGPATVLRRVIYPSPNLALLIGGTVFRSTDQGETWTNVEPPAGKFLQGGDMLDERRGMIVGNQVILRTDDGGVTWDIDTTSVGTDLYAVSMYDSLHAFAVGKRGAMYRTEDGGESWQFVETEFTAHFYHVQYFSSGELVVGHNKGIVRSSDHGKTWSIHNLPNGQSCFGWASVSPEVAMCAMDLGLAMKTTDGGKTWNAERHNIESASGGAGHMYSIAMLDEKTIYLAGGGGSIVRYRAVDSSASVPEVVLTVGSRPQPVLQIVPNPAKDQAKLMLVAGGIEQSIREWQVVDMTGRVVLSSTNQQRMTMVPLASLLGGYYIVRVYDNAGRSISSPMFVDGM
ncbi:MAG: T9SS type A sorting domain-containing protein [Ignavibacteriae bacterium]|nr:T9SS type A sorting domain-containing protein [Ignavibacteriota bacterium]MCB9217285.1 T9SS type A sorting domain-containing protein [Ignavibacteria bacterium]